MKTSEVDLLIMAGHGGSSGDHWQARWVSKIKSARWVPEIDWTTDPDLDAWTDALIQAVALATKPVVLVGHSLGVLTIAHAAPRFAAGKVRGALLVAVPDVENPDRVFQTSLQFAPIPAEPLYFPTLLIASKTDTRCTYVRAEEIGKRWKSGVLDAGDVGHINEESGHGPWPEGTMVLSKLLSSIS
ncbi:MAG: serine hydrolase family protein [Cohaesibacteraceae bacterium]|nr:serine hydrolase family protein [Cohaesibacteraceae bacterium]